jgi:dihydroneopterin aldolase
MRSYWLRLKGVRFDARIGASRAERSVLQEVVVDIDLELGASAIPAEDDVRLVTSYDTVASLAVDEGQARSYQLLETYVARTLRRLLAETPALSVRVTATKARVPTKHPVDAAVVEMTAERGDESSSHARKSTD